MMDPASYLLISNNTNLNTFNGSFSDFEQSTSETSSGSPGHYGDPFLGGMSYFDQLTGAEQLATSSPSRLLTLPTAMSQQHQQYHQNQHHQPAANQHLHHHHNNNQHHHSHNNHQAAASLPAGSSSFMLNMNTFTLDQLADHNADEINHHDSSPLPYLDNAQLEHTDPSLLAANCELNVDDDDDNLIHGTLTSFVYADLESESDNVSDGLFTSSNSLADLHYGLIDVSNSTPKQLAVSTEKRSVLMNLLIYGSDIGAGYTRTVDIAGRNFSHLIARSRSFGAKKPSLGAARTATFPNKNITLTSRDENLLAAFLSSIQLPSIGSMSNLLKVLKNIGKTSRNKLAETKAGPKPSDKVDSSKITTNAAATTQTNMLAQVILNNGVKMPRIGLGTYGVKDKATCLRVFSEALTSGYRLFDTGTLYGNDEFIGDVVYDRLSSQQLKRDEVFIETKIAPWQHGRQNTNEAVAASLKRLKLSYIDMVLIHWPGVAKVPPNDPKNKQMRAETWQELEDLVSQGKIKSIGVSNYTENHLQDLLSYCKVKPTVNQVEFHPMCYQERLLQFCKENSIYLQAYSSLGSSQSNPPGWTVLFNDENVKSIAKKLNRTIPQVLLRWGIQHDCLLIPKTSKIENLKPNLDIMDFQLDDSDMKVLNGLNKDKHFCWNPAQIS